MRISIVGAGYVGLVTGACLAELGHRVTCIDIDKERINRLQEGRVPVYEPRLEELVRRGLESKRLSFAPSLLWVSESEVVFLCVGTPAEANGHANLSALEAAVKAVGAHLHPERTTVVATKSTVPPGTWRRVREWLGSDKDVAVASCPEFLKEGHAVEDFMRPDRIVIGADHAFARRLLRKLHEPILRNVGRIFECDPTSAELSKYATNAMLFTRVSFMNELARYCDAIGADVDVVRQVLGADDRIGPRFLFAGPGAGGSCFRKDVRALWASAREAAGVDLMLSYTAFLIDEDQRAYVAARILELTQAASAPARVCLWGLSFKPETDDIRESPALSIAERLARAGVDVHGYDPKAGENTRRAGTFVQVFDDPYEAAEGCDLLCLVTEWSQFKVPDWAALKRTMRGQAIFDARNLWDPQLVRSYGFHYVGMGRGEVVI